MSDSWLVAYVWLIPALPLAAAILTGVLGPNWLGRRSHLPCVIASVLAALFSLVLLFVVVGQQRSRIPENSPVVADQRAQARPNSGESDYVTLHPALAGTTAVYRWITVGDFDIPVTLRVDPLTALMLVMVTFVGCLIVIYSVGYLDGDPGRWRFFSFVALFLFSMTMLVLASNFLLLYVFWEAVGLCSYLLIGFWYQRPAAAAAAKKAFLVNRIGDFGFALAILLIWFTFSGFDPVGDDTRLDYDHVFANVEQVTSYRITDAGNTALAAGDILSKEEYDAAVAEHGKEAFVVQASSSTMLAICLLLFCGAVGKSAQFPLHVWLPDATEGPTPVSALIHAATMVTAGVYMVARFTPLFQAAPTAQMVVAAVGGFTALLAALIALTQTDLKRILAYSTISQFGYMFLALGCGSVFAISAAIFHVFTHAFFKALLFLGAGSVMHAMGGVMDINRFGGLRRRLPITCWTFAFGAASLAGVPLLSGFWSKHEILAGVAARSHEEPASWLFSILLVLGMGTAFLSAFYTFRAFFKTFWGPERLPEGVSDVDESPVMTGPLLVLAVFSVAIGLVLGPTGALKTLLGSTPGWTQQHGAEQGESWGLVLGSSAIALGGVAMAGVALAWWMYGRSSTLPDLLASRLRPAYELSKNKFWFDELYQRFVVGPTVAVATASLIADIWVVDAVVRLVASAPSFLGRILLRPVQNGLVQFYALGMLMGLVVLLLAIWVGG